MRIEVIDHPLVAHKLTLLRDENTPSPVFRQLVDELVTLLAYEATRDARVEEITIKTPVAETTGVHLSLPTPIVVPILRAGLGMLEGMAKLLPSAEIGFLGLRRDEETLEVFTYANRLPDDLSGRQCYVLDPMLATGATLIDSINYLLERGARDVTCVCLLGAPEGVKKLEEAIGDRANVTIFMAALDDHLNEKGYIVPGLGDAGDRLYGVVD
ncbi:MAG: uracil phosphoribosyltransferase [Ancrocorticia sp.]